MKSIQFKRIKLEHHRDENRNDAYNTQIELVDLDHRIQRLDDRHRVGDRIVPAVQVDVSEKIIDNSFLQITNHGEIPV